MTAQQIISKLALQDIDLYLDQDHHLKAKAPKGAITAVLAELITKNKSLLVDYLQQLNAIANDHSEPQTIEPLVRSAGDKLPVSFAQQRLWFIDSLQGGSPEYNMPMVFEVTGQLDTQLLTEVFKTIVVRHEILRTVYLQQQGETVQQVRTLAEIDFTIAMTDLTHLTGETLASEVKALVENDISAPFDLSQDLMLRLSYLSKTADSGVLIFNMHHIASDGWSMEILSREFFTLLTAYHQGQPNPLPELAIQYADFAHWQRQHLSAEVLQSQLRYWQQQLDELPLVHALPLDHPRPQVKQYSGAMVIGDLPASVAQALMAVAKEHKITPFMLLHGGLALLLSRHSNSYDVVIGTPVANRLAAELAPLIGFFVNTLVLRIDTRHATLADYFGHVRQIHLGAQANQDVPFEQLVERLNAPRRSAHSPLFQIMLTTDSDYGINESDNAGVMLPGIEIQAYQSDAIAAKYDLEIALSISERGLALHWTYDVSLFTESHIEQLNADLCRLLTGLSQSHGQQAIQDLPMLSQDEHDRLVHGLNPMKVTHPKDLCIHQLFEQQAKSNPHNVAVVFSQQQLTYQQLNQKANQLAHYLKANYVIEPDTTVGLCVERSLAMVIAMLAILKAGGAYVPLDPNYPQQRLNFMLEDAGLELILCQQKVQSQLAEFSGAVLLIDHLSDEQNHYCSSYANSDLAVTDSGVSANHLAYVIYTSGSTGQPKGVLTEHVSVARLVCDPDFMVLNRHTVMMQCANIAFDAATLELWGPLLNGGQCILYPQPHLTPSDLNQVIEQHQVNALWLTAGLFREWSYSVPADSPLQYLLAGGDVLDVEAIKRVQQALPELVLINGYGPTENTTFSTTYRFAQPHHSTVVPIGKKLASDEAYILSATGQLVPYGSVGELYVGGDGLARGYLNRPELTAERFISNPFYDPNATTSAKRLYRTGDLVRYLPDGNLAFIGRVDEQVKIRGFRIELGEVQAQLTALESVDSAQVLTQPIADSQQLVAYVKPIEAVASDQQTATIEAIKNALKLRLPEYMLPSIFILLQQWPLTANGKIDKKALPAPDGTTFEGQYSAPESETEQMLATLWAELLKIDATLISVDANFFELGGHSLLSMRLLAEIRTRFAVELSIQNIFDNLSLKALASAIEQGSKALLRPKMVAIARHSDKLPVSFAQQRLWFIDSLQGGSAEYNIPVAFEVKGHMDMTVLGQVFTTICERHEVIRTVYLEQGGQTLQHIRPLSQMPFNIQVEDLSQLESGALASAIKLRVEQDIITPFDLASALMLRVSYLKKSHDSGVLLFNMHHIASDGWSMEILTKEFFTLYQAYSQGLANPLPALDLQYADYAQWQRQYLDGEVLESQLSYWQQQLDQLPAAHSLPLDYRRPAVKQHQGAKVVGQLPAGVAGQLLALAKQFKLTPFMLLHGAVSLLLSRHSNSHDIIIGTPVANRLQVELEPLIGYFVNSLVLRVDTRQPTLADYFAHVRQVHLDAQSNQDVPFEQLVERLKVPRNTAHSPIFQIMMAINADYGVNDNSTIDEHALAGVEVQQYKSDLVQSKFDLDIEVMIDEQGFGINWYYDTHLFSETHINQLNQHLCRLLETLGQSQQHSTLAPFALPLLCATEIEHLLVDCNDNRADYPNDLCIHQLIEQQAKANPNQVAVLFNEQQLSYQQLNEKANQLAHYLKAQHQITPDSFIGVCVERSLEMVIGILAILKAGGAYVPLDPNYPQQRLNFILEDAALSVVLSHSAVVGVLSEFSGTVLTLDNLAAGDNHPFGAYHNSDLSVQDTGVQPANLAYVIYTSGSTGTPKGVMIEHQNAVAMLSWGLATYSEAELTTVLASTSLNFDLSIYELFLPLVAGTQLRIVNNVLDLIHSEFVNDVTLINTVPSAMEALLKMSAIPEAVKVVNLAGEALSATLLNGILAAYPNLAVCNLYGPSEDTTYSTYARFEQAVEQTTHIGRVISNSSGFVLDEQQQLVPYGVPGELYLGGAGLARGYLNQPDLTAERFIHNPFYDPKKVDSPARLYRTGDLVKYRADGNLDYIGRVDHQVKIRGFRIELGEIENQLSQLGSVDSAMVMATALMGSQQLVAYVKPDETVKPHETAKSSDKLSPAQQRELARQLQRQLKACMPEYMVPSIIMMVEEWPLTPNGKLDRASLPTPDATLLQGEYVAPESPTEHKLVALIAALLNIAVDELSVSVGLSDVGAHSLLLIKACREINDLFETNLTIKALYENNTVAALAAQIDKLNSFKVTEDELAEADFEDFAL